MKKKLWLTKNSLRKKVLLLFLPLICATVALVGISSFYFQEKQIKDNAVVLINNTVNQTAVLLNDRFSTAFQQLVGISESSAVEGLILNDYSENDNIKYDDMLDLSNQFDSAYLSNANFIDSFYFNTKSGSEVALFKDDIPSSIGIDLDKWLAKYQGSDTGYYWLNTHTDTVYKTQNKRQVISAFYNIGTVDTPSGGVLLMNLKSQYFADVLKNVKVSPNGYIMLISNDGIMDTARLKNNNLTDSTIASLRKNMGGKGSIYEKSISGKKMLVVYQSLKINRWIVVAVIPQGDLLSGAYQFLIFLVVIIIMALFISSYFATCFAKKLTNSIEYLSQQVEKFDSGKIDVNFNVNESNEIGVLANGLSCLVKSVSNLVNEVKLEQERKMKVELLALQSQIKPHFLYNTLGSIKNLIDMNKNDMASKMCGALSKFYMIGISKGKEIITVRQEIEHVRNYLLIQKMRYGDEFNYEIAIDEDTLDASIIKLTIQPIVENAIYHGIKNKEGSGMISISGQRDGGDIKIEIYDDGVGMNTDKLSSLKKSICLPGIEENPITFGLRNVNQRIILHYGKPYGIEIKSVEGVYTRVIIRVPFYGRSIEEQEN